MSFACRVWLRDVFFSLSDSLFFLYCRIDFGMPLVFHVIGTLDFHLSLFSCFFSVLDPSFCTVVSLDSKARF